MIMQRIRAALSARVVRSGAAIWSIFIPRACSAPVLYVAVERAFVPRFYTGRMFDGRLFGPMGPLAALRTFFAQCY